MVSNEEVVQEVKRQQQERGKSVPKDQVIEVFDEIDSDYIQGLANLGYLGYKNSAQNVIIQPEGHQLIRDKELIQQSKVSSASETVFTYALLFFSWIQIQARNPPIDDTIINVALILAVLIASLFGLGNVWEVAKMRLYHLESNYMPEILKESHII
jgi:hypothetical protein